MSDITPENEPERPVSGPNIIAHIYPSSSLIETLQQSVPDASERFLRMMEKDMDVTHSLHRLDHLKELLGMQMAVFIVATSLFLGYKALELTSEPVAAAVFVSLPVLQLAQVFIIRSRRRRDSDE